MLGLLSFFLHLSSLSGANSIVSFLINEADLRCSDHSSSSTYLSAATGHLQRLATVCFLTIFYSFFLLQNNSLPLGLQLFILTERVCSCEPWGGRKAISGPIRVENVKKRCKRKICVSLLRRFTWSFSLLHCQYLSMVFLFFCFIVRAHASSSITVFLFCLFVPKFA